MRLVWDTSSLNVSAAIFDGEKVLASLDETREIHQQSRLLFFVLKELLDSLGLSPKQVTEIGVGIGPGSYTGLRVGVTVAKTWSFAQNIKCFSFLSSKALERTKAQEAGANYPKVRYLLYPEDFSLVQDLNQLKPLYHNDHFDDGIKKPIS